MKEQIFSNDLKNNKNDKLFFLGVNNIDLSLYKYVKTEVLDNTQYHYFDRIISEKDKFCQTCNTKLYLKRQYTIEIKDINSGMYYNILTIQKYQFYCPKCKKSLNQDISFVDGNHKLTNRLRDYINFLKKDVGLNFKEISKITGVDEKIISELTIKRLKEEHTIEGKELKKPESLPKFIAIDEFLLHKGKKYATIIIDLKSGKVLWVAKGKKKSVVYDFLNFVGLKLMKQVQAVACDMNSDFKEAFLEKCPHLKIVYDHFHLIKNYNEIVIDGIRKSEQEKAKKMNDNEYATLLKKSKHLLMSSEDTRLKKDKEAAENKLVQKESSLFNIDEKKVRGGNVERYNKILEFSELLKKADEIKIKLGLMYKTENTDEMIKIFKEIINACSETQNQYFMKFRDLLLNHYEGIITHAQYFISSGKIEGINNKIKVLRRKSYGIPVDETFFLLLFDM